MKTQTHDRVIICGMHENLIRVIASYLEGLMKGRTTADLSRIAVVFGGKRPALFLKRELSRRLKKDFFPPAFFSMDDFVRHLAVKRVPRPRIGELDAGYTVFRLAAAAAPAILTGRETFAQFLPWASEIAALLEQLDLEDVPDDRLLNVQSNAEIGYDVPDSVNVLLQHIVGIRREFVRHLETKKLSTKGQDYLRAARIAADDGLDDFDEILFCNLYYMHRTEETLVKALFGRGKASVFLQGDENDWSVLKEASLTFSRRIRPDTFSEPKYRLKLYAGFDTHSQAGLVREIIKEAADPAGTLLVLPDPKSLLPVLSEISPHADNINVSLGYPLNRSSLYSLLECVFAAQSSRKGAAYYSRDYLRAVSHPLVKNIRFLPDPAITRTVVHKLEEVLSGTVESPLGGSLFVNPDDLTAVEAIYPEITDTLFKIGTSAPPGKIRGIVSEIHEILFRWWEGIDTFSGLAAVLERFVSAIAERSYLTSHPVNLKTVERLHEFIDELRSSAFSGERFPEHDILKIVRDRISGAMISFSGTPLKGLQVLGMMESRSLNFENVIVMDANESVLPSLPSPGALIPRDVMLSLGLRRLEKEEEIQRHQFMRLVSGAKNVHLVYAAQSQKEKSRFIEELAWNRQKKNGSLEAVPVVRASFDVRMPPPRLPRCKNADIIAHLRGAGYSATKINTYVDCPARFYYRYVLGLREKEDLMEEPEGVEIGTFVHEVLNEAFRPFIGGRPVIDDVFRDSFFRKLNDTFDRTFRHRMKSDAFLVKEVIDHRMEQFLAMEKERPVELLVSLEDVFAGSLSLSGRYCVFEARIDRIDKMSDGSILIVDYKTGAVDHMPGSLKALQSMPMTRDAIKETINSFQLPLYVHLTETRSVPGTRINAALYNLRLAKLNEFFKEPDDDSRQEKMRICLKALECMMDEIVDPGIPFAADDRDREYCLACPFHFICR